ncbi:hypothetical protein L226DRAFT_276391 [Lentinus tigrinus ALCF2SS1-7]|uniref:uncharacterized protein n=1 Tax=Lentinus tigrinus ALCF2SS1-7 TaxID=1328758 RepID=UPI0011660751|nr:hypothetical protein L226DRAFT_276391 [Lentinus tigrinus ALCF2SS1-7]
MCCRTRLVYEVTTNNYEVRGSGGSKLGRSAATATATTLVQYSFFSRYVSYYRICRTVLVRAWTLDAWFPGRAFFLTISHCFATNDDSRFVTSYVPGYACGILKMIHKAEWLSALERDASSGICHVCSYFQEYVGPSGDRSNALQLDWTDLLWAWRLEALRRLSAIVSCLLGTNMVPQAVYWSLRRSTHCLPSPSRVRHCSDTSLCWAPVAMRTSRRGSCFTVHFGPLHRPLIVNKW